MLVVVNKFILYKVLKTLIVLELKYFISLFSLSRVVLEVSSI